MRRVVIVALVLAGGCRRPPDPLAARRADLAAAESAMLAEGWRPQVSTWLSDQGKDALVAAGTAKVVGEGLEQEVSMAPLPSMNSVTTLDPPKVTLTDVEGCVDCVGFSALANGSTALQPAANATIRVGWKALLTATLRIDLVPTDLGRAVQVSLSGEQPWDAKVQLKGVPPMMAGPANQAIHDQIGRLISQSGLTTGLQVARIPLESPVQPTGVRVDPEEGGVRVDVAFGLLTSGEVGELPRPTEGWSGVVPAATLLGIADAALLRQPLKSRFGLEVRDLALHEGGFDLTVRLWKAARTEKWRDYKVPGTITLGPNGVLQVELGDLEKVGSEGGLGAKAAVVKGVLKGRLGNAAVQADPQKILDRLGAGLEARMLTVTLDEHGLVVTGLLKAR